MNQVYGICNLSLIPLRSEPSEKSEMISQLLFGDRFQIHEVIERWARIQTSFDDYEGWIDIKQFTTINLETYNRLDNHQVILGLQVYFQAIKQSSGEVFNLVAGSCLPDYTGGQFSIKSETYSISQPAVFADPALFSDGIIAAAMFYLNSPYLWGGRSLFGIDCSGFSQIVFKQFDIKLRRDAWQQALQGETVDFLQETRAGDLAFFDNEEGRIIHVGILLNEQRIIHASGRVKIDTIDTQGIYSADLKRYTHKLRIIKRFA
jgi:gamma-D-glutamyl-L-lysine dipeptidyl-peptidase